MTKLRTLRAYVPYLAISSSLRHYLVFILWKLSLKMMTRGTYPWGALSDGISSLFCVDGTLSTTGVSMFVNGHLTYICTMNESSHC